MEVIDTDTDPANAPPSGVMLGVLTVAFFELLVLVAVSVVGDLLVMFDAVVLVAVTVADVDVLVSVFNG